MQKITPFLWFDDDAEEAVELSTSLPRNSKVLSVRRYGAAAMMKMHKLDVAALERAAQA